MGFASLAWLGALATLFVPLAIHLWSRRRTTPVPIGSIRFLRSAKPVSRRTVRLRHPWRLLMRLTLLASLILALAGTYLERPSDAPVPERWLLVGPVSAGDTNALRLIDTLGRLADEIETISGDPWSAIASVDAGLPDGSSIDVIASTRAVRGARPVTRSTIHWFPMEAESRALEGIALAHGATSFAIMADPGRRDDGRYLAAAVEAIAGGDNRVAVPVLDARQETVPEADWIAWLSDDPPPPALLDAVYQGVTLVTDPGGMGHGVTTTIPLPQLAARQPVRLMRRGPVPHGVPWWRDGEGTPLLTVERVGEGVHYRLGTRLHPAWTDLVFSGGMPEALAPLIGASPAEQDQPLLTDQVIPTQDETRTVARLAGPYRSLFLPLWALAAMLFVFDVILMHAARRSKP